MDVDLKAESIKTTVCTEASVLSKLGIESFVFGPGAGQGNIDEPNESVALEDLNKATEFYKKVIERVCL